VLDGLVLEVDLPGGRDAVPFVKGFHQDVTRAVHAMLGDGQYRTVLEHHRHPHTMRVQQRALMEFIRSLLAALSDSLPMLIGAVEHEGPLRASLRSEYGMNLRDPGVTLLDLADLVANLPAGCALYRAIGGPMAWTEEVHLLAAAEFRLRVLAWMKTEDGPKGRNQPKPIDPPKSVYEKQAEQRELSRRAQAYLRRTGRLS
jgi:hypothetical protein